MICSFCKDEIEEITILKNYHKQCAEYLVMNGMIQVSDEVLNWLTTNDEGRIS